jgi:hypothetical protein
MQNTVIEAGRQNYSTSTPMQTIMRMYMYSVRQKDIGRKEGTVTL